MFLFAPIRWALKLISTLVFGILIYLVVCGVQIYLAGRAAPVAPPASATSAAIVVYAPASSAARLSSDLGARLREVRMLWLSHDATRVVVVGPSQGKALATSMSWLSSHGLAAADLKSAPARNLGAALHTLAPSLGRASAVTIVTDRLDALVDRAAAGAAGLSVDIVAVPKGKQISISDPGTAFREASAMALGRIIDVARVPWSGG